jgi:hypothetical protein
VKARISFLFWLAVAFLGSLAGFAQTPQPQIEQPLNNAATKVIKGVLNPAGLQPDGASQTLVPESCRFTLALLPGEKAIEARRVSEINVNRSNNSCDALFEVGEPLAEALALPSEASTSTSSISNVPIETGDPASGGGASPIQPGAGLQVAPPAQAVVQSAGFLKTWWIDPINITVNSVQNSTTWRWSGTGRCVTGILGGQNLTWFTPSGWFLLSDSWNNTFNCTQTTSASTVAYDNPVFCALISTFATYNPNRANGLQNGVLLGSWNDIVFGSVCVNLLRFRMQLQRTQN